MELAEEAMRVWVLFKVVVLACTKRVPFTFAEQNNPSGVF
jgi:hypothetical protein